MLGLIICEFLMRVGLLEGARFARPRSIWTLQSAVVCAVTLSDLCPAESACEAESALWLECAAAGTRFVATTETCRCTSPWGAAHTQPQGSAHDDPLHAHEMVWGILPHEAAWVAAAAGAAGHARRGRHRVLP